MEGPESLKIITSVASHYVSPYIYFLYAKFILQLTLSVKNKNSFLIKQLISWNDEELED